MFTLTLPRIPALRPRPAHLRSALALVCIIAAGCKRSAPEAQQTPADPAQSAPAALNGTVTVSTAASMTDVITELGRQFNAAHTGVLVAVNSGSTNQLATQIEAGAPVDVFISADPKVMQGLIDKQLIAADSRKSIAGNALALITPADGLAEATFEGFAGMEGVKRIALGNPETVPAGRYAKAYLMELTVWEATEKKAVYAENVRQALDYIVRGEAEAGIVYLTDAKIEPEKVRVLAVHPLGMKIYDVAVITATTNAAAAHAFAQFVAGPEAKVVLEQRGFSIE